MSADKDLSDVTLACEDNPLIESHKLILAAARMPPDGGQPIVNTVLAVIRAKRDHLASITDDWKTEIVKAFGKEDVLEARNILMDKLKKQSKVQNRRETKGAMNDIIQWLQESEAEVEQLEVVCRSSFLPQVAAFMVRTNDLGPEAVVSLSTRMGIMEEHMKAMTEGFNSLKKEVQKETAGERANSHAGLQQEQVTNQSRAGAKGPSLACFKMTIGPPNIMTF